MALWFVGGSVVAVWLVFRDTAIDYRLVAVGSLLPDLVDLAFGGPGPGHAVLTPIVVLGAVMLGTVRRRAARRRLLGVPIGLFLHLVLDGAWTSTRSFWWPLTGLSLPDGRLPSLERGAWTLLLEVVGAALLAWFWLRFDLVDPGRRRRFLATGRLDRALAR